MNRQNKERQAKFTILVPTREKSETLLHTLRTCLSQNYDRLEIIVSDNASTDQTQEVVHSFNDPRLRVVNTGKRVSMSENFEFALSHASDGYLMFLGDDDGVVPRAVEYVNELIGATESLAVACCPADYTWPNFVDERQANRLEWNPKRGYEIRQSRQWLADFFSSRPPFTWELPGIYRGFVHRSVISKATRGSTFFRSQTPDAYAAIAVAHHLDSYTFSFTPFAITGTSAKSHGASQIGTGHQREADTFVKENTIPFHGDLVRCPSLRVVAMEAYFQFISQFPEFAGKHTLDWRNFLAHVLAESTQRGQNAGLTASTPNQVAEAVKKMCGLRGIPFETLASIREIRRSPRGVRALRSVRASPSSYRAVRDARFFGVNNIYDASLLVQFFEGLAAGHADRSQKWKRSLKKRWNSLTRWSRGQGS